MASLLGDRKLTIDDLKQIAWSHGVQIRVGKGGGLQVWSPSARAPVVAGAGLRGPLKDLNWTPRLHSAMSAKCH
jgi:hypothetical protein